MCLLISNPPSGKPHIYGSPIIAPKDDGDPIVEALRNLSRHDSYARAHGCAWVASITPLAPYIGPVFVAPVHYLERGRFIVADYYTDDDTGTDEDEDMSYVFAFSDTGSIDDLVAYHHPTGRVATLRGRAWALDAPDAFFDAARAGGRIRIATDVGAWLMGGMTALCPLNWHRTAIELLERGITGVICTNTEAGDDVAKRLARHFVRLPIFVDAEERTS